MIPRGNGNNGANHNFWLTGIGGFLGVLTVLVVLLLAAFGILAQIWGYVRQVVRKTIELLD